MDCDICGSGESNGTVVRAADMSKAATRGYNPYVVGFPSGSPMEFMAARSSDPSSDVSNWTHRTISGNLSTSDWYVCSRCMSKLSPFLLPPPEPMVSAAPLPSVSSNGPSQYRPSPPPLPPPQPRQVETVVEVAPAPSPEVYVSTILPFPDPLSIGLLRAAIARTVKGVLIIVGVLVIEGIIFSFQKSSGHNRFTIWDWIALAVALFITGFGSTLYRPASDIASHYLIAGVNAGKTPAWCGQYLANLTSALRKTILLVFVGIFYAILMPMVSRFNERVLGIEMITTVLNVLIIISSLIVLFLIGKRLYPLIDHFSQHVTDRVAPIPVPDSHYESVPQPEIYKAGAAPVCPNCQTQNDAKALFCAACGSSLASRPAATPPRSDKKICSGCSAQNERSSKFCFSCGAPL